MDVLGAGIYLCLDFGGRVVDVLVLLFVKNKDCQKLISRIFSEDKL